MDPYESAELDELMAVAKAVFAQERVLISIRTQIMSLTASAEGGIWSVVWIAIPSGFFGGFGQLWEADIHSAIKDALRELRKSKTGDLLITDGSVRAHIESDLPEDAILQLAETLPEAPSGEIRFDRKSQKWVDSLEWERDGDQSL